MAGWWQHRRSPYHLTCWLFYNQKKGEQKSWSACQQEAKAWSKVLWGQGATGPPEGDAPPPVPRPRKKKKGTATQTTLTVLAVLVPAVASSRLRPVSCCKLNVAGNSSRTSLTSELKQ